MRSERTMTPNSASMLSGSQIARATPSVSSPPVGVAAVAMKAISRS